MQQPLREWLASGIAAFEFTEGSEEDGNEKTWRITEILSTKDLVVEGRAMQHCVATYAHSCSQGICSIWKLDVESYGRLAKHLTIEVQNSTKVICQARGKRNVMPQEKQWAIVRRWAAQEGLQVAECV